MCGIVGAVSTRNIVPILVQGLQRLEYRGYDSCGLAVHVASLNAARLGTLHELLGVFTQRQPDEVRLSLREYPTQRSQSGHHALTLLN